MSAAHAVTILIVHRELNACAVIHTVRAVVRAMLTSRAHVGPAVLLVWGVVTGVLGVAVTIDKQVQAANNVSME